MGQGLKGPWLRYVPNPLPGGSGRAKPTGASALSQVRPAGGSRAPKPPPAEPLPRGGGLGGASGVCSQDPFPSLVSSVDAKHVRSQDAPEQTAQPADLESPTSQEALAGRGSDRPPAGHPPQLLLKSGFAPGSGVLANAPSLQFSTPFRSSDSVMFLLILKSLSPSCCSECKSCNKRAVNARTLAAAMCSLHGRWLFGAPSLLILSETDCTEGAPTTINLS